MTNTVDEKLKEFEKEFSFKDKPMYGLTPPDFVTTTLNGFVDEVQEWLKQALEEVYEEGIQEGMKEMESYLQDATEAAYQAGLDRRRIVYLI